MSFETKKDKPKVVGKDQLQLERLVLGLLSPTEASEIERRYGSDWLEERKGELEAENVLLLQQLPPERVVRQIERRLATHDGKTRVRAPKRNLSRRLAWAVPAMAAAVLLLVLSGVFDSPEGWILDRDQMHETTRIKGLEPSLRIYMERQNGGGETTQVDALEDGAVARPGDVVQVGFVPAEHEYAVIVSIDGAGAVTLHTPDDPDRAQPVQGEGQILLERGFRLDDAPSFERFFLVTADTPIIPGQVIDSARALANDPAIVLTSPLILPESWEQTSFTLIKETR